MNSDWCLVFFPGELPDRRRVLLSRLSRHRAERLHTGRELDRCQEAHLGSAGIEHQRRGERNSQLADFAAGKTPFERLKEVITFNYEQIWHHGGDLPQIEIIPVGGSLFATDFFPEAEQRAGARCS